MPTCLKSNGPHVWGNRHDLLGAPRVMGETKWESNPSMSRLSRMSRASRATCPCARDRS